MAAPWAPSYFFFVSFFVILCFDLFIGTISYTSFLWKSTVIGCPPLTCSTIGLISKHLFGRKEYSRRRDCHIQIKEKIVGICGVRPFTHYFHATLREGKEHLATTWSSHLFKTGDTQRQIILHHFIGRRICDKDHEPTACPGLGSMGSNGIF